MVGEVFYLREKSKPEWNVGLLYAPNESGYIEESEGYCQLKSNWADFLPRPSNLNPEQSMRDEFVYCRIFGQIYLT